MVGWLVGWLGGWVGGGLVGEWLAPCSASLRPCALPPPSLHQPRPPSTPALRGLVGEQHGGAVGAEDAVGHQHGAVLARVPVRGGAGCVLWLRWGQRKCGRKPLPTALHGLNTPAGPCARTLRPVPAAQKHPKPTLERPPPPVPPPVVGYVLVRNHQDVGVGVDLQHLACQVDRDQGRWGMGQGGGTPVGGRTAVRNGHPCQ